MSCTDGKKYTTKKSRGGDVRKNMIFEINGKPCKITVVSTSMTVKHGNAKCNITGVDVFTGKTEQVVIKASAEINEVIMP